MKAVDEMGNEHPYVVKEHADLFINVETHDLSKNNGMPTHINNSIYIKAYNIVANSLILQVQRSIRNMENLYIKYTGFNDKILNNKESNDYNVYYNKYYDKEAKLQGSYGYVPSYSLDSSWSTTISTESTGILENQVGCPYLLNITTNETGQKVFVEISYSMLNDAILDKQYFKIEATNKKGRRELIIEDIVYTSRKDASTATMYKYFLILRLKTKDATNELYYNSIRHGEIVKIDFNIGYAYKSNNKLFYGQHGTLLKFNNATVIMTIGV